MNKQLCAKIAARKQSALEQRSMASSTDHTPPPEVNKKPATPRDVASRTPTKKSRVQTPVKSKEKEKPLIESSSKMQYEKEVINCRVDEIWREVDRLNNALKVLEQEKSFNEKKAQEEIDTCIRQRDNLMERVQVAEKEAEIKTAEVIKLEVELRRVVKMNEHLQKQNSEQRHKLTQFEQIEVIIDKPDGKSLRDLISETVDINNRYDSKLKTTTENFTILLKKHEKAIAKIEILERDNQVLSFKAGKASEYKRQQKPIDTASRDNKIKHLETQLAEAHKNMNKLVKEITRWKIESSNSKAALAKELCHRSNGKESRTSNSRQSNQISTDPYNFSSSYQSSHNRQLFQRLGYIPNDVKQQNSHSASNSFLEPITPARIDSATGVNFAKHQLRKIDDLEVEPSYRELTDMHDDLVDRCRVLHDLVHLSS